MKRSSLADERVCQLLNFVICATELKIAALEDAVAEVFRSYNLSNVAVEQITHLQQIYSEKDVPMKN